MQTASSLSGTAGRRLERITLSVPVQASLYTLLWAMTLWTLFFSTYPAVHNQAHSLRHHTLGVACH